MRRETRRTETVSRRAFLRTAGAAAGALAVPGLGAYRAVPDMRTKSATCGGRHSWSSRESAPRMTPTWARLTEACSALVAPLKASALMRGTRPAAAARASTASSRLET